ncbi:MAG: hypothetical protein ACPGYP_04540 [Solirubrobacterales bacterium]
MAHQVPDAEQPPASALLHDRARLWGRRLPSSTIANDVPLLDEAATQKVVDPPSSPLQTPPDPDDPTLIVVSPPHPPAVIVGSTFVSEPVVVPVKTPALLSLGSDIIADCICFTIAFAQASCPFMR